MEMRNSIPKGTKPTERGTDLGGKPAKEFRFRADEVDHVMIKVRVGDKPVAKDLPESIPAGNGFESIRLVINLGMVKEADPSKSAMMFDPPMELRIRFTKEDLGAAGGRDKLKLAYRQGQNWVPINFEVKPDDSKNKDSEGYLFATISEWPDDPPVAVGK